MTAASLTEVRRSVEVRESLVRTLRLDLVGPRAGGEYAGEWLPGRERPSVWYLTGFLVPSGTPAEERSDDDTDGDFESEVPESAGLTEESEQRGKSAKRRYFPASMGLSFFVRPGAERIRVTVSWGDYRREKRELPTGEAGDADDDGPDQPGSGGPGQPGNGDPDQPGKGGPEAAAAGGPGAEGEGEPEATDEGGPEDEGAGARGTEGKVVDVWVRYPRSETIEVEMAPAADRRASQPVRHAVPNSGGLGIHVSRGSVPAGVSGTGGGAGERFEPGTQAVSVFLVNDRETSPEKSLADERYVFQAQLDVECDVPFHPRHDPSADSGHDLDGRIARLHYADTPAYATGHGVSADWTLEDGQCRRVRTAWIGAAEVEATRPGAVEGAELSMEGLGSLADGEAARAALQPLVAEYRRWVELRRAEVGETADPDAAELLLTNAARAAERIEAGVEALADEDVIDAFRVANRTVGRALRQVGVEDPKWRPFQLAFLLLNLPSSATPSHQERETVELLFFPTGGGKTEAYLGLAAFVMVLRRLRHPGQGGRAGAGVSVIMRYTLRLLTLDQYSRAARLVCALELEREKDPDRYGEWPFEVGLWVGKAATPNKMGKKNDGASDSARLKAMRHKSNPRRNPAPIPIESCPWCGRTFDGDAFALLPNADAPRELRVVCTDFQCDFSGDRPLPIAAVDEPLYRRLPAFLIATVDKFASLPWEGPSGALLGGADRYDREGFYGPARPARGQRLGAPLPPPDLVIQDELHLIAGPLGTMMGLYETAVEGVCTRGGAGVAARPKIVASTATARRAADQVQAVFARAETCVFPPPGPDRRDSFFAHTVPAADQPARRYLGIAATGRNPKHILRRVMLAQMAAAEKEYREAGGRDAGPGNPADPYMTLLAYFNSLRELGGARRIVEEEVRNTLRGRGGRRRVGEKTGLFRDRGPIGDVVELTSREPTDRVAEAFKRLARSFDQKGRVDCAIATNMISVGLDVPRLGLMVVNGQPKTHAEYIQATSRVGRAEDRPGLVVTLLNMHRPRDRSHFERFRHYHETFYRSVESASVTPFASRALDRGLAGALLTLARHTEPVLTPPRGVQSLESVRRTVEERVWEAFRSRVENQPGLERAEREELEESVRTRIVDLLDSWTTVVAGFRESGVELQYQKYEDKGARPLMRHLLDEDAESPHLDKFRVNRSLRDVEPEVHVYVKPPPRYDRDGTS